MSVAMLSASRVEVAPDGTTALVTGVVFDAFTAAPATSSVTVAIGSGDTLATVQSKLVSALDAEAAHIGRAAPTVVLGPAFTQYL